MNEMTPNSYRTGPDEKGMFGIYGGRFVAETLMPLILELEQAYKDAKADPAFQAELDDFLETLCGPSFAALLRRTPDRASRRCQGLHEARRAEPHGRAQDQQCDGADFAGPAHGQEAASLPKPVPAQHGVATATACARFGLKCVVYMGEVDIERQKPNVFRMKIAGC